MAHLSVHDLAEAIGESRERSAKGRDWWWWANRDWLRHVSVNGRSLTVKVRSALSGSVGLVLAPSTITAGLEVAAIAMATASTSADSYRKVRKSFELMENASTPFDEGPAPISMSGSSTTMPC